ncbi:MAG: hypothetical protein H0V81_00470 [Solirubrobacterales bacterium]|nr:hypothetical protein [Solirubrobacterales bacterium]
MAKAFQIHPTRITMWKQQLTSQVAGFFKQGPECDGGTDEEFRQAYEKIGRLYVEWEWLKNNWAHFTEQNRQLIDEHDLMVSIQQQCDWVGLSRSAYYYTPAGESQENFHLMRLKVCAHSYRFRWEERN